MDVLSRYLTIGQAAGQLGIHTESLRRNIKDGAGPHAERAPCGHMLIHERDLAEYKARYVGQQGRPRFVEGEASP